MCVIVTAEKGSMPTIDQLTRMSETNPDGAGIAWHDGNGLHRVRHSDNGKTLAFITEHWNELKATSATPGTRPDSAPRRRGRRMGRAGTSAGPRLATAAATRPVGRSDPPHPKNRRTTDGKTTRRPRPRTRDDHTSRDDAAESSASSVGSAPSGAEAAAGRGSNDAIGEGST